MCQSVLFANQCVAKCLLGLVPQEAQQASERAARAERELEDAQEHSHQQLQHRLVELESRARDSLRALQALEEERDAVSQQLRIAQVSDNKQSNSARISPSLLSYASTATESWPF